ncbi:aldo/keto reductase [Bifidobacterium lemurum]|uniref:Aldo/keto reductase n=1 Tax=Bifidobacterium lemurum TaxID=1603886 RepID=A0A261FVW7_9BIFI|nr:aldo/keto reductase [Bifidobacterium lemurum]OZG63320.1 aldo/keto reductase [Bifidobacterium lemurum]QOL34237.1 aldo/keto reductase [Bifidobacterium lemurum]
MIRKTLTCMLACVMGLTMAGCSGGSEGGSSSTAADGTINATLPDASATATPLVVYYSYSGNTRRIAQRLATIIDADSYEIRTVDSYPENPHDTAEVSQQERNSGDLPELVDDLPDLEAYDTIYIGGPIWNGYMATPLERYLESTDFSGKTVVPFSTSMGSGQSGYLDDFNERVRDPETIGSYTDIEFPDNGDPDAFTDEQIDELLSDWLDDNDARPHVVADVTLNSGYTMPMLGLGTWTLSDDEAENCVYHALEDGYRLVDTAQYYGNEVGVGRGVRKAIADGIVTRDEVFVTTKIMPGTYADPDGAIQESLDRLNLEYIDLLLLHQPGSHDEEVYRGMERAVDEGVVRSIGISNYYTQEAVDEVLSFARITPAVIQNEHHIYNQDDTLQRYVSQYGIAMEGWYPFGGRGHTSESFNNETIMALADEYGKTSAQIILRWQLQTGFIAIPGSSNPDHIAENHDIFDFELTDEDMRSIGAIDEGLRYEEAWHD